MRPMEGGTTIGIEGHKKMKVVRKRTFREREKKKVLSVVQGAEKEGILGSKEDV